MQPYPFQQPQQITAPASSKALTKLKNDKLIPAPFQIQGSQLISFSSPYQAQQNPMQIQGSYNNMPSMVPINQVKFNSSFDGQSRGVSPASFNVNIQRQNSGGSLLSSSQNISQTYSQNQMGRSNNNITGLSQTAAPSSPSQTQQHYHNFTSQPQQQYMQSQPQQTTNITKPLSAFQRTNNISTNVDVSRIRSSSASQFSLNNFNDHQKQKRVSHLESKLVDYNQQILQSNIRLSQKQKKITELEQQLSGLRKSNSEGLIKLKQIEEGDGWRKKKIIQLENENKVLRATKLQLQAQTGVSEQKIKNLESSLDKILESKNLQIQSLNQSCKQISKHVQVLQDKYEQQIRILVKKIEAQQQQIKNSQIFIQNANLRLRSHQQHKQTNQLSLQVFTRKLNQNAEYITTLQNQCKTLKTQLSAQIEVYEKIFQHVEKDKLEKDGLKKQIEGVRQQLSQTLQQLENAMSQWGNERKIGGQQIQFLNGKIEEGVLQRERLKEQIELTKAITYKRNMIFERRVIYELKQQNDRLWAKLIQKSDTNATQFQNSPQYWTSYRFQLSSSQNFPTSSQPQPQSQPQVQTQGQKPATPTSLQQKYRGFIEQLQREQDKTQIYIGQLRQKQERSNKEDMQYYKKKCIDLQNMVGQHLKINMQLKRQLQKVCRNSESGVGEARVNILQKELQKQQVLHKTLERSFQLFKEQYQERFKLAQQKVSQIEQQHKKQAQNEANTKVTQLKKIIAKMEQDIHQLRIQNSNFSIKTSEAARWESLYKQLKAKSDMSPIGIWKHAVQESPHYSNPTNNHGNQDGDVDKLLHEIQRNRKLLKAKQQQIANITRAYDLRCESYQQEIRTKQNQLGLLQSDLSKIQREFGSGKLRYDQLVRDISRLQSQLQSYKTGARVSNPSGIPSQSNSPIENSAYMNLIRQKLKQISALVQQARNICSNRNNENAAYTNELLVRLYEGIEAYVRDCLAFIGNVRGNGKDN